jgi:hypothetical protein
MKAFVGIVLAALSMAGLTHQNKVITPPTLAVSFPKATFLSAAVPAVVTAPVAKPSKAVTTAPRLVAAGIVLGTSTSDGVVTQSELQAAIQQDVRSLLPAALSIYCRAL